MKICTAFQRKSLSLLKQTRLRRIHQDRAERCGDEDAENGDRQNDVSARQSHGERNGSDGGLHRCLGKIGKDGVEPLFFVKLRAEQAQKYADRTERKSHENHCHAPSPADSV